MPDDATPPDPARPERVDGQSPQPEQTSTEQTWSLWQAVEHNHPAPAPAAAAVAGPAAASEPAPASEPAGERPFELSSPGLQFSNEPEPSSALPWPAVVDAAPSGAHHASHGGHHRSSSGKHKHRRRRRRVRWGWIGAGVGGALLLVVVAGGIAGFRFMKEAKDVQAQLEQAKSGLSQLTAAVKSGDQKQMKSSSESITVHVTSAQQTVGGPLWNVAARVPVVGQNVDAVQRVTRAMGILSDQALTPGLQLMSTLKTEQVAVKNGGIDLAPFKKAQASVPAIATAFQQAQAQLAPIDTSSLMSQVAGPVDQISQLIDSATPQLDFAQKYLPTLLDIAGGDGKKTYLLIFQNNAEIRATGGNPGASMIMTVDNGKFKELDQASSTTFYTEGTAGTSFTKLPASAAKLYRDDITTYSQNFTMTPDFPTTATLFQNEFKHSNGQHFDGVISIDPVVLSQLLAVAGPATLSSGEKVTADNAVKLLLSDAYERYPYGAESDAFFSDVSKNVFNHLLSSHWDAQKMLDALTTAAEQQRIYLNFTDKKAQSLAADLGVDGALKATDKKTQVGMYLNDSSVSKLEYWLTQSVHAQCNAKDRTITTTLTLNNSIPNSIQSSYTLGERNSNYGLSRQTMMLDVFSFAPPGGSIASTDPKTGQVAAWNRSGEDQGNKGVSHTVFVPQGETVKVSSTVKLPDGDLGKLDLRYTPTARDTKVTVDSSCDALFSK